MNFLFVTDNTWREHNPVFNICMALARRLSADGHGVVVLGNSIHKNAPPDEVSDGIRFVRFYHPLNPATWAILDALKPLRRVSRVLGAALRHPLAAVVGAVRALIGWNPIVGRYARRMARLCAGGEIDAVVSFSAPYYTARALGQAHAGPAKKIVYMADPYATHRAMGGKRAERQERRVMAAVDAAIVTPEIYAAYEKHPALAAFLPKLHAEEFPSADFDYDPPAYAGFAKDRINGFYAGNFYPEIRPVMDFLRLVEQAGAVVAPAGAPPLHFTVMGNLDEADGEEAILRDNLVRRGLLTVAGPQPTAVAAAAMRQADFLVNLGNQWADMLPSKLYDYIAAGRPIVNLCRLANCPSLPRLAAYPLALNLFAADGPEKNAAVLAAFARNTRGQTVPRDVLETLYADCTPQHMCGVLVGLARGGAAGFSR